MSSLAFNKRANFDYEIREKFEAGIELKGYEVKAVKLMVAAKAVGYHLAHEELEDYIKEAIIMAMIQIENRALYAKA